MLAALGCPQKADDDEKDVKLPNGKSQQQEILKEEHKKSLRDVAEIREVAEQLQTELDKNDYHVLSIASLKKAERIEKLARQIQSRMRR